MSNQRAFTLLEVLIAMAILSIALLVLARAQDNGILVSQYEEQQITAANLARWKMVELELFIDKKGFGDDEKEECGKFEEDLDDRALAGWEWCWTLKKVNLPLPMDAGAKKDDNGNETAAPALPGGLDPKSAGEQLSKAVRVLKLTIKWKLGETPQSLDVVTHLVNFSQAQLP